VLGLHRFKKEDINKKMREQMYASVIGRHRSLFCALWHGSVNGRWFTEVEE